MDVPPSIYTTDTPIGGPGGPPQNFEGLPVDSTLVPPLFTTPYGGPGGSVTPAPVTIGVPTDKQLDTMQRAALDAVPSRYANQIILPDGSLSTDRNIIKIADDNWSFSQAWNSRGGLFMVDAAGNLILQVALSDPMLIQWAEERKAAGPGIAANVAANPSPWLIGAALVGVVLLMGRRRSSSGEG